MEDDRVDFGKYRGQPVQEMRNDCEYMQWLQQKVPSKWKKYAPPIDLHQNRLQNRFLCPSFVRSFLDEVDPYEAKKQALRQRYAESATRLQQQASWLFGDSPLHCSEPDEHASEEVHFEHSLGWHVVVRSLFTLGSTKERVYETTLPLSADECPATLRGRIVDVVDREPLFAPCECEVVPINDGKHVQVTLKYSTYCALSHSGYHIHIQPHLGDDYPHVLRQMKYRIKCMQVDVDRREKWFDVMERYTFVVMIETVTAQSATFEEVQTVFEREGIRLVRARRSEEDDPLETRIEALEKELEQMKKRRLVK